MPLTPGCATEPRRFVSAPSRDREHLARGVPALLHVLRRGSAARRSARTGAQDRLGVQRRDHAVKVVPPDLFRGRRQYFVPDLSEGAAELAEALRPAEEPPMEMLG